MKLKITKQALNKLNEVNTDNMKYLLLFYDRDDCGCGVNGVPTIRLTNEKRDYYDIVINDDMPTFVPNQQAVFFNKELKLEYRNGFFQLLSKEETLNAFISLQTVCPINK
ncbi:iron-sulfur cluster biosynthesis family protein [Oceanobacillus sp. Castelsardo]|uniref:iron-sulfur cluster biosynthesis family protein n=1 Tax=Oceanobacillus sp. Castelsardo TaxID=1851204 RepID=UPI0008388565|nr:iron-sulfur cluster biosynthesis family protein [Oceanobacillus sp. Castelsardo]